jgi:hypothetical protein
MGSLARPVTRRALRASPGERNVICAARVEAALQLGEASGQSALECRAEVTASPDDPLDFHRDALNNVRAN